MKELFTNKFWREVKKTFDEAREPSAEEREAPAPTADVKPAEPSTQSTTIKE